MTVRAPFVALALLLPASALAQSGDAPASDGPPPALAGIPIAFDCAAELAIDHPALRRYPGEDATDLAAAAREESPGAWLDHALCTYLWEVLDGAGAHPAPEDVRLPARGVLKARLRRMWIEGSRVVEQRIGSTIMPVSIPHWAVAMTWSMSFAVEYSGDQSARAASEPLEFELAGSAEQDDYAPLRLDSLLRGASLQTFSDLPRVLADDGHLGDLLFAIVPSPDSAPEVLGLSGGAAEGFWQLLSTRAEQRHDAMAFYLASEVLDRTRRIELARWFLVNDPDVGLRRDALGWLLQQEDPDPDARFSEPMMEMLGWLILRERSSRVRAEAVRVLGTRPGEQTRALLIAASTDGDPRVAERAMSGLRSEPPPTAADLASAPTAPPMPALAKWTAALDGRVTPERSPSASLVELALAVGGPASETWLARFAVHGKVAPGDEDWALGAFERMVREAPLRVRVHTLERLARSSGQSVVAALIEERIREEKEPNARIAAIRALKRFDRPKVDTILIDASRSGDADVRLAAVEALTKVPGARVDERLARLASDDPAAKVRRKARKVIRARAKEAWESG